MREQRLIFGEVADLYDRHRPRYPAALIDDLVAMSGADRGAPVLEVGAGTGKATTLFAARGIPVVAVEPSSEMAALARRNCSVYAGVRIEQSDFEDWEPRGRTFPLLFSAQAWHWVEPSAGFAKARQVLLGNGLLAAFWNRVAWASSDVREPLLAAYRRIVPELRNDAPMHPANLNPDADADWEGTVAAAGGFADAEIRHYDWEQDYSAGDYVGLLATLSEIRLLDEARRSELFTAVTAALDAHGTPLRLPMRTRLCLARRA